MDDRVQAAMRYLSSPAGSFWRWRDDGTAIAWLHGATIAFRDEVAAVLQRLSPRGLPSFDSVVLLLAATRTRWPQDSVSLREKLAAAGSGLYGLDQVHSLPSDLIHPIESKSELANAVFETFRTEVPAETARVVCEILSAGMVRDHNIVPGLGRLRGGRVQTPVSLIRDVAALGRVLDSLTEQSVRLRLQTGLEELPQAAEVIIPAEPLAMRSLLQDLAFDDELSGLSRIARHLMAVLQLPRAIADSDDLPLGGVSDITNRGALDRLLLSELVHDDLMLATRVALNEALYLRRETPPGPPPEHRHVLLDSGLRMWGVPRVYAAAVMLSLAAGGAEGGSLTAFRASGKRAVRFDPATREGLIRHLEALELDVDPAAALEDFFQHVHQNNPPGTAIVITSDVALADPGFRATLSDVPCQLVGVNREGDFQLWQCGNRGARLMMSLKLDLDELLVPASRRTAPLIDRRLDPDLPALFRASRMPFRLPYLLSGSPGKDVFWSVNLPPDRRRTYSVSGGDGQPVVVASESQFQSSLDDYGSMILTSDHRLLLFDDLHRGAVQIADGVPFGKLLWSGSSRDDHLSYALIYSASKAAFHLLVVNVSLNWLVASRELASEFVARSGSGAVVVGATCRAGILYVIYRTKVEAIDLAEGRLLHQLDVEPRMKWKGSRYFYDERAAAYEEWHALTCDASGLRFEKITLRGPERTGRLLCLFDRAGHDGPFGVHLRGTIANLSDQTEWEWTPNPRSNPQVLDISDRGDRVLVEYSPDFAPGTGRQCRMIHVGSQSFDVPRSTSSLALWDLKGKSLGGALRHRFSEIYVGGNGKLTLVSKSLNVWTFEIRKQRLVMTQVAAGSPAHAATVRPATFAPTRHPNPGCRMMVATWNDGSRVFVDSRGLLHLQSSDRSIAEASLVLNDHDVAAWTSDGRTCGGAYFVGHGDEVRMTVEDFVRQVLIPFTERLR